MRSPGGHQVLEIGDTHGAAAHRTAMSRPGPADRVRVLPGGLAAEDCAAAVTALRVTSPRPSAVLAFNGACATGTLSTFFRAGVAVPGEISVVGFADSRPARLPHVDLTTVAQDTPVWPGSRSPRSPPAWKRATPRPGRTSSEPRLVTRGDDGAGGAVRGR
ncbi:substrate-binding domain-containing protein [Streptomyces griseoruber]|uniref:substrate-binding domain-containing protein n=1 Tax=Streptomyces griseoruber TaxID=1943 RepID=UPI003798D367